MRFVRVCNPAMALGAALLLTALHSASAQSVDPKAAEQLRQQQGANTGRDVQKKNDDFAEAARVLGGPASNPECLWLGRRVVNLIWRDDLDTAFRHMDLYDRFGCPSGHIQATFRCLVRQGHIDPKAPETLSGRVHACWLDPSLEPAAAPAAAAPAGTTNR